MNDPLFSQMKEATNTIADAVALYRYDCAQIPRLHAEIAAIRAAVIGTPTARQVADIEMRENSIATRHWRITRTEFILSRAYNAMME